jgi:hypothetical protein
VEKTEAGESEPLFMELHSPFYGADFRRFQVVTPDADRLQSLSAVVVAMEQNNESNPDEKALMAIRFSNEWFGTQFHPEAHPDGMVHYLRRKEKKSMILQQFGEHTYEEMMHNAIHPDRLANTRDHVLPGFLEDAVDHIMEYAGHKPMVY